MLQLESKYTHGHLVHTPWNVQQQKKYELDVLVCNTSNTKLRALYIVEFIKARTDERICVFCLLSINKVKMKYGLQHFHNLNGSLL